VSVAGFLIVDKPSGVTSFSMVALVRRLTGVRRVGHAGTLDPLASGVLPVAVGYATRFIEYLDDAPKTYEATLRLGAATTTYDAEGEVTATGDASGVTEEAFRDVLRRFVGEVRQTPPRYSAIKLAGKPLYRYAREGLEVDAEPRTVRIDRIELRRFEPRLAEISVVCGKGTYIRSLAHDAGEALGCHAHLAALRRTSSGGFGIELAHTPNEIAAAAADWRLDGLLLAPDRAVERRPAAIFEAATARRIRAGNDIELAGESAASLCRAYTSDGDFVGMLEARGGGLWHPEKVVSEA
jgi:tRNA pseudouridine55 synthase